MPNNKILDFSNHLKGEKLKFKVDLSNLIIEGSNFLQNFDTDFNSLDKMCKGVRIWFEYTSQFLSISFSSSNNVYKSEFCKNGFSFFSGFNNKSDGDIDKLYCEIEEKVEALKSIYRRIDLMERATLESKNFISNTNSNLTDIFIVHGHDQLVLNKVARQIEKQNLSAVILHEKPNEGQTIIEKFEKHSDVNFAIVILTADDMGKSHKEQEYKTRARQNVILELGYFIGKLGRARVLPLYQQGVELPSDFSGVLYTEIDNSDRWVYTMIRELKKAGYSVDANLIL